MTEHNIVMALLMVCASEDRLRPEQPSAAYGRTGVLARASAREEHGDCAVAVISFGGGGRSLRRWGRRVTRHAGGWEQSPDNGLKRRGLRRICKEIGCGQTSLQCSSSGVVTQVFGQIDRAPGGGNDPPPHREEEQRRNELAG
ncbi:MAG: hypothetical protein U0231_08950 [Nitrospiraceae bacterium]